MRESSRLRWAATLIGLALACNVLTPGTRTATPTLPPTLSPTAPATLAPTEAPSPTAGPTSTPEPFSIPDPIPFVTGLEANLQARIVLGEWTLEEGLVTTLKFLAGEVGLDALNPSGIEIHSYAGTGVIRMARGYLQSGADEAAKAELQRLLTLILPDSATLKRFSRPAQAQGGAGGRLARPNVQMEECRALWADGWPEGSTATCFEYRRVEANGGTYEIFYPLDWPADDPRRIFFEPTVEAVEDSARTFARYGAMPASTTLVFTLLPDPVVRGAYAVTDQFEENGTCRVAVLPPGLGLSVEAYKQTIAHELFHCYQFKNYWAQMSNYDSGDWWIEGTAEYFGNVVYPTYNAESEFWGDFDVNSLDHSTLDMDYENVVFFQYLANRVGDEGVLQLIASMPSSGGRSAQMAALAGYPDMGNLFHSFARAYLDRQILDTGGGLIGIAPGVDRYRTFDSSRTETVPTNAFVVTRALFVFPERTRHIITEEGADELMTAAKPVGAEGWAALPEELSACEELRYIYAITKVSASDSPHEVSVSSEVEEMEESEGCDRCLVGRWQVDTMSHWDAFLSVIPRDMNTSLQSLSGEITAEFTGRGRMTMTLDNFDIHYTQDFSGSHVDAHANMSGLYQSIWYTDREAGILYSVNPTSGPVFSGGATVTTQEGQTINVPVQQPPVMSSISLYQCSDDTLLVDSFTPSGVDGQYVTWHRIGP